VKSPTNANTVASDLLQSVIEMIMNVVTQIKNLTDVTLVVSDTTENINWLSMLNQNTINCKHPQSSAELDSQN